MHSFHGESSERLTRRAVEAQCQGRYWHGSLCFCAEYSNLACNACAYRAILVGDLAIDLEVLATCYCGQSGSDPFFIKRGAALRAVIADASPAARTFAYLSQHRREIQISIAAHLLQQVDTANCVFNRGEAVARQQLLQVSS